MHGKGLFNHLLLDRPVAKSPDIDSTLNDQRDQEDNANIELTMSSIKPHIGSSSLYMSIAKQIWNISNAYILALETLLEFIRYLNNILDLQRAPLASLNIIISFWLCAKRKMCINLSPLT